ncbi:MAG TPA: metallopeptidase TldD-related protein [Thermomicrobiaceae bacterium]|nr:metallopeptidase TldD-related protein [Thermomicrobiaceae bacterium]
MTGSDRTRGLALFADRFGIDEERCNDLLGVALEGGGDYADLFFEYHRQRRLSMEDQRVSQASSGVTQGVGIRVIQGDAIGYASTDRFGLDSMREAARTAAAIAASSSASEPKIQALKYQTGPAYYPVKAESLERSAEPLLALLRRVDEAARSVAPSVEHVNASLFERERTIVVATSEGRLVDDVQPMVSLSAEAVSVRGSDRQSGYNGKAARAGLDFFASGDRTPEALGRSVAEWAVLSHEAVEAPAGFLPVVLAAGDSGILLHEAVGHGLEADFNRKRLSNFSDRIGQLVASPLCTVVDNGTLPGMLGSINVDDEGRESGNNLLIENGILRGYLHDWMSARHYSLPPSGNGRRQDYRFPPMPRMTTTYMLPGESDPDEIVRSVRRGIFCRTFSNGSVNISSGDYVFATREAFLIEDGRITAPIRTVNLIGNGPDSLSRVTMVGNDLRQSDGTWNCGKRGQSVPVSLGLPTVLIDGITVGGTRS